MNTSPVIRFSLRDLGFDANRIARGLYQGARPPRGSVAARLFDVIVFCAIEYQPSGKDYPGVKLIHCPLNDDGSPMTKDEWIRARCAARDVAIAIMDGKRVLITCHAGINRSGLVSALALRILAGQPGEVCLEHVRRARPGALRNEYFSAALRAC